jgi:hypothetical protein
MGAVTGFVLLTGVGVLALGVGALLLAAAYGMWAESYIALRRLK